MTRYALHCGVTLIALLAFSGTGCEREDCPACPPGGETAPQLAYVGSSRCGECHTGIYNTFVESGHPYKLSAVVDGTPPVFPWDGEQAATVAANGPPPNTDWSQFAYVVGGFGWKARWILPDGNVYTGTDVQLNLATGDFVEYHAGETKLYDYSCFKCHTTGASPEGSWPEGTTGFGTFEFGGVQCEECHGQGSQHASDPPRFPLVIDRDASACGRCHTRDPQNRVAVSIDGETREGFIRHHEQFDEIVHSPHGALGCVTCHDPHASVVYDDVASGSGVTIECISCHEGYDENNNHIIPIDCVVCHMPKAAKSARAEHTYKGDVSSHTFMIRSDAVGMTEMWTSDGKFLKQDEFGKGRLTLDFACYSCHRDESGVGGSNSIKTLEQLSVRATNIHGTDRSAGRSTAARLDRERESSYR